MKEDENMATTNVKPREGDIFTVIRELENKPEPPAASAKPSATEVLPNPVKLRESLLAKRDIFRKLEKEGYLDNSDINDKVNKALKVLDEIIRTTA